MKRLVYLIFFIALSSYANDLKFDIKAFGTIGVVHNSNSDYIFRKNTLQKNGSSDDLNYYTDTIFGVQGTLSLNDNLSIISQLIAQKNYNDKNSGKIDWLNLKYDTQDNLIFKIGRIKLPYYKNSNNQNIGYSRLMIREPIEVYGQVPFSAYNGIELIYTDLIGKYFYTLQANYGRETFDIPMHSKNQIIETQIKDITALNLTFGTDEIETRATYMRGNSTVKSAYIDNLFSLIRQTSSNELADKYEFKNKTSEYYSLGLFIDYNNFILQSEYGKRKAKAFYANAHGYYATFGYRIKKLIPYVSYAKISMDEKTSNTGSAILDQLMQIQNIAQVSNTLGFKYQINENLDFKFEYQKIRPQGDHGGFYIDPNDNYPNTNLHVYSFVIDFIF